MELQEAEEQTIFEKLLDLQGPNVEFLSSLPLDQLLLLGVDERVQAVTSNDHFWKSWVQKNLSLRHTDELIQSIPGSMKWRYYARVYGRIEGSKIYCAVKEGDVGRFFPYLQLRRVQKIGYIDLHYFYLVDGRLCFVPRGANAFYDLSHLVWDEWTSQLYIYDFVQMPAPGTNTRVLLLLSETGEVYLQEMRRYYGKDRSLTWEQRWDPELQRRLLRDSGFFGDYETEDQLLKAAERASSLYMTFSELYKIPLTQKIVAIAKETLLTDSGHVYKIVYDPASPHKASVDGQVISENCISIQSNGEALILLETLKKCRPVSIYDTPSNWDPRFAYTRRITEEWTSEGKNSTYFYLHRGSHAKSIPVNTLPKNKDVDTALLPCPKDSDKPIKLSGIRDWYKNRAAWTLSGQLYTAPNDDGGNGLYSASVHQDMPQAILRPAVGIPDFVVGCCYEQFRYARAFAVALPRSQALKTVLDQLEAQEGDRGLRTLAKLLQYPSAILELPTEHLKDILWHEPFTIVNKIPLIPHVEAEISKLPKKGKELSALAKQIGVPHFTVKTKLQLQHAIAQAQLLKRMPELAANQYVVPGAASKKASGAKTSYAKGSRAEAYARMRVPELRKAAKTLGVERYSSLKKAELVAAILNASMSEKKAVSTSTSKAAEEPVKTSNLSDMTVMQLRKLATKHNIKGRSKMKKAELLRVLEDVI